VGGGVQGYRGWVTPGGLYWDGVLILGRCAGSGRVYCNWEDVPDLGRCIVLRQKSSPDRAYVRQEYQPYVGVNPCIT